MQAVAALPPQIVAARIENQFGAGQGNTPFTPEFEVLVLSALHHVSGFAETYAEVFNPRYLQLKRHELWAKAAFDLTKTYKRAPSIVATREQAHQYVGTVDFQDILHTDVEAVAGGVTAAAVNDLNFAVDSTRKYIKTQALLGLGLESRTAVYNDLDGYVARLNKALRLGETMSSHAPVRYIHSVRQRIESRRNPNYDVYVPTNNPKLDEMLLGGLRRGKMALVLAPPAGGKSTFMTDIGAGGLELGKKVLHVTHEVLPADQQDRYDTRLTGIPTAMLRHSEEAIATRMMQLAQTGGDLIIQYWPAKSCGAAAIRALINQLREENWHPDVLICDYPELWVDPPGNRDDRHRSGDKYRDFFTLCRDEMIAGWCGSQANRDAFKKGKPDLDNVAEDWSKIQTTDVAFLIGANDDMLARGQAFIRKGKDRDRLDGQLMLFDWMKELQTFR